MKRGTIPVFAVATAITVANIYFTQPLLERIALDLGVSSTAAGGVATAGQIGYALGIVAIVPSPTVPRCAGSPEPCSPSPRSPCSPERWPPRSRC